MQFELDTDINTNSDDEYRIGCSNYQQGSTISKLIIKDNDQQAMVPYIVNYQSNGINTTIPIIISIILFNSDVFSCSST